MKDVTAAQVTLYQAVWSYMLTAAPPPPAPSGSSEKLSNPRCASGHGSKAPEREGPCSVQVKSQCAHQSVHLCQAVCKRTEGTSMYCIRRYQRIILVFMCQLPYPLDKTFFLFLIFVDSQEAANLV